MKPFKPNLLHVHIEHVKLRKMFEPDFSVSFSSYCCFCFAIEAIRHVGNPEETLEPGFSHIVNTVTSHILL